MISFDFDDPLADDFQIVDADGNVIPHQVSGDEQRFWMENTPIPLDMIFIDAHGRVLNVERARPFSRENVVSAGPALYNIEVRAGFAERHGITEGVLMRWWEVE